ncbi:hypothetical protein D3C85_1886700 [compost metagenome]
MDAEDKVQEPGDKQQRDHYRRREVVHSAADIQHIRTANEKIQRNAADQKRVQRQPAVFSVQTDAHDPLAQRPAFG